jgi:hypothetical protein
VIKLAPATKDPGTTDALVSSLDVAVKYPPVQLSIVLPAVDTVLAENCVVAGFVELGF